MFTKEMKLKIWIFILTVVSILSLGGSAWAQGKTLRLSIAGGPTGAGFYATAGTIAQLLTKYIPDMEANAEATQGSVDNCKLVGLKKSDIGFTMGDIAYEAVKGAGKFKSMGPFKIKNICVLFPYYLYFVTIEGSGINSVRDLKGRRVATGNPGAGTEVTTMRVLEYYGMDINKDLKREHLHGLEAVNALKDRKVDALAWVTALPAAGLLDLGATPGIKMKIISNSEFIEKLRDKYGPIYSQAIVPKNVYPRTDADVAVVTTPIPLICHEDLDVNLIYKVLKVLVEHQPELAVAHKDLTYFTAASAATGSPISFHPGSLKYFKEKGVRVE